MMAPIRKTTRDLKEFKKARDPSHHYATCS
jgi:hypothetical protein